MNNPIARQRCKHHQEREAFVRCPSCGYFYCSECSTEYDGRHVCRTCLESLTEKPPGKRTSLFRRAVFIAASCGAFLFLWFLFFFFGETLLSIPDTWFEKETTITSGRTGQ
jgi:hypothetical protein